MTNSEKYIPRLLTENIPRKYFKATNRKVFKSESDLRSCEKVKKIKNYEKLMQLGVLFLSFRDFVAGKLG